MDNFTTLWGRLRARASTADPLLAQDYIKDAYSYLANKRNWAWRRKAATLVPQAYPVTDTISLTNGSAIATSAFGAFTQSMIGRQLRAGGAGYPLYTLARYVSATQFILDRVWQGPNLSGATYQVLHAYFTVPADFQSFYSIVNQRENYRLWTNLTQAQINLFDPQRVNFGSSYGVAYLDSYGDLAGQVESLLRVSGSSASPAPVATSDQNGFQSPEPLTYVVQISTGGAVGTCEFTYFIAQYPGTTYTLPVLDSNPIDLSNGVQLYFPTGTYVLNDTFIINCKPATASNSYLRYELWPRPTAGVQIYPYLYITKLQELTDARPELPNQINSRGDVILEIALSKVAQWPGTSTTANPYFNLALARQHAAKAEELINQLEMLDNDIAAEDFQYTSPPYYPAPWADGSWLQTHAPYPY